MSADRTIDVRIAELLGAVWTREPEATADWLSFPQVEPRTKNPLHLRVLAARFDDGRIEAWPALLAYQSDIGSAWLVVAYMGDLSCDFTLERAGAAWYADFRVGAGSASTPAAAICLAALDAFADARPPLPTGGETR